MGKFARITWPSEHIELKKIEDLLLCGICYEYMETSVMTPCSHNYCSLCIRKYLYYKTQCPICFEKTFEKDLHTNRILDEIIRYFIRFGERITMKEKCVDDAEMKIDGNNEACSVIVNSSPTTLTLSNYIIKTPQHSVRNTDDGSDSISKAQNNTVLGSTPKSMLSPNTSRVVKKSLIFTPKGRKDVQTEENSKKVTCPVCSVDISDLRINRHLDDCLKRETVKESPPKADPKHKPLPKLVFNLMKDGQIRKILRDHGLSTQGDRKRLEMRFQRYSILYNAECDKQEPKSIAELIKQCEEEELVEKRMQKSALFENRLQVNRKTNQSAIEEAQRKYLETNKTSFQTLIKDIKSRNDSKKSIKHNILNQSNADIGIKRQNTTERISNAADESNESDPFYALDHKEFIPQDSDSSSFCPLQWYSSDNPMNYLSVEMSSNKDLDQDTSPTNFKCEVTPKSQRYAATDSDCENTSNHKIDASSKKNGTFDLPLSFSNQISKSDKLETAKTSSPDISEKDPFIVTTDSDTTDLENRFVNTRQQKKSMNKRTKSKNNKVTSDQMENANLGINISETSTNDPYNVTTDSNSSDLESTDTNTRREEKGANKRAKLCSNNLSEERNINVPDTLAESESLKIQKQRQEECKNLVMSITKDFSFDSSSNDSVGPAINDGSEEVLVPKTVKESIESSASNSVVCRPSRRKNFDSDSSNNETTKLAKRGRTSRRVLNEQNKNERSNDDGCVNINLKRKRGSQRRTSSAVDESKMIPRRITRRCNVNPM